MPYHCGMTETIRVQFDRRIPLFPLQDTVLLPHALLPLLISESRHCQLVNHCLDGNGQFAIATMTPPVGMPDPDERTSIRPAVCVGRVVHHQSMPTGEIYVLLHGVCRALVKEIFPEEEDRGYLEATLSPMSSNRAGDEIALSEFRDETRSLLMDSHLQRLNDAKRLLTWTDHEDIPTHVLVELLGQALLQDSEDKYTLLSEPDLTQRVAYLQAAMYSLNSLIRRSPPMDHDDMPRGTSIN